jgi:hypothetical protein
MTGLQARALAVEERMRKAAQILAVAATAAATPVLVAFGISADPAATALVLVGFLAAACVFGGVKMERGPPGRRILHGTAKGLAVAAAVILVMAAAAVVITRLGWRGASLYPAPK